MNWTTANTKHLRAKALDKKMAGQPAPKKVDIFCAACTAYGLPDPVKEYRFDAKRRWRIDYYFEHGGKRVGLEVEGGIWSGGRHTRGKGFAGDMEKYNAAQMAGIAIVRVQPSGLMKNATFEMVKKLLT